MSPTKCFAQAAILLLFSVLASAQAQPAISSLPPDHHDVYNAFFQDHVAWQGAIANSPSASALLSAGIAQMHIEANQASTVAQIASQTVNNVNAIAAQRGAYVNTTASPSQHTLNQFEIQRQAAIMSGVSQLMKSLTLASWHGLHWYINGPARVNAIVLPKGGN